jgi:soluble lytic murein transglycosylase-like protein
MLTVAAVIAIAVLAAAPGQATEIRMEERDGVLYVRNIEPPPAVATANPSASKALPYRDIIHAVAAQHTLAPELVESVIRVESNFEPRAVSPKGARGLMQLMPATAAKLGVRNVFDVRENVEAGVRHLRDLVDRYQGNLALALAAYNAGVEAVARHGGIPPFAETQAYVARILRLLQQAGVPAFPGDTAPAARALYGYKARDGLIVYTNLPIDRLSPATRALLGVGGTR